MKAEELRIGNYVTITPHSKEDVLQLNQSEMESLYIFKNWDRLQPIPLTEEWLLRFGFYVDKTKAYINYGEEKHSVVSYRACADGRGTCMWCTCSGPAGARAAIIFSQLPGYRKLFWHRGRA